MGQPVSGDNDNTLLSGFDHSVAYLDYAGDEMKCRESPIRIGQFARIEEDKRPGGNLEDFPEDLRIREFPAEATKEC